MNVGLSVAITGEYIKMLHMDSETDNVIAFEFEYSLKEFKRRGHKRTAYWKFEPSQIVKKYVVTL